MTVGTERGAGIDSLADPERLAAVWRTGLLDAPAEEAFGRFARAAAMICEAPVALVSLLDDRRQFFLSAVGVPEPWLTDRQVPLSHSFCRHVVASGEALVVDDARMHPLLHANLAVRELNAVSYIGIPLVTAQGQVVGTFSVVDSQPRAWSEKQVVLLTELGASVMSEIALRTALREQAVTERALQHSERRLASELAAMTRLHSLVGRLLVCRDLPTALQEVLAATIEITGADMGNVQLFRPQRETLEIVAQQGFQPDFLDFFRAVRIDDDSACSRAMRGGERVIIEDVLQDPGYEPLRAIAASAGYRAVQSTPLLSVAGELLGMLSTHHRAPHAPTEHDLRILDLYARQASDFIERVRSQEALSASEAKLSAIIERLPVGIGVADLSGRVLSFNSTGLRMHGFRSNEEMLQHLDQYVEQFEMRYPDGEPMPAHEWPLARTMRGEQVSDYTVRLCRPDGEQLSIAYDAVPLPAASDEDGLIAFVMHDISEREQTRQALQQANVQSQAVFNQMTEGLVVFDPEGYLVDMNPAALAIHGFNKVDGLRRHLDALPDVFEISDLDGRMLPTEQWPIGRVLRGESFDSYKVRVRRTDTGKTWIGSYGGSQVCDADGKILLAIVTLRDVTDQYLAEAALRESDRRKDEFLATLAHELRNPLAPIYSGIELLRLAGDDPAVSGRALPMMERQIKHLIRLVDDLLDLSRISRGKVNLRRENTDLVAAIRNAVETCGTELRAGNRQVSVELPSEPLIVYADPVRLVQIIANLLGNAAKYTSEMGRITISTARSGDRARVYVRDDGAGIAPDMLDHVFEMFRQAEPTRSSGLGIGLTLVKNLVQLHGGEVHARSDGVGQGAEFSVQLPLAEPGDR